MKCYILYPDFGCPTQSLISWALEPGGPTFNPDDGRVGERRWWHPYDDTAFEIGGNTWAASGPLTAESKDKMSRLWAHARGGTKPYTTCHVLGAPGTQVTVDIIVHRTFVETMTQIDPNLFDFTPHDKVWDPVRNCPPWDGAFFFATVLPMVASYDLDASDLPPVIDILPKYKGAHGSSGARRAVRASTIAGRLLWRDAYTRQVMCTDEFLKILKSLGVPEWKGREVQVIQDGH